MNKDSDNYNKSHSNYNKSHSSRGRRIDFDDDDFAGESSAHSSHTDTKQRNDNDYGRHEHDWADDLATRANGRISADYDDYHNSPSQYGQKSRRKSASYPNAEEAYDAADTYDELPRRKRPKRNPNYEEYSDDDQQVMDKPRSFRKRHPVLMNLIYAVIAAVALMWVLMWFLDYWTFHGEERVVPDVKGQTYASAAGNVDLSGLRATITDSVFDSYSRPGTVVDQIPVAGAKIKKGGTVYLTIVAFSPKLVTVPDFYNVSARQARSMFEGIDINDVREVAVVSEYEGLVLGAKFNGVNLQPGAKIPVSAVVTIEVGTGYNVDEDLGANIDTLAIENAIDELNIE